MQCGNEGEVALLAQKPASVPYNCATYPTFPSLDLYAQRKV